MGVSIHQDTSNIKTELWLEEGSNSVCDFNPSLLWLLLTMADATIEWTQKGYSSFFSEEVENYLKLQILGSKFQF